MEVLKLTVGDMASNCYIIKKNNQVLIVDPGDWPEKIIEKISEDENVLAVLLTHGHFDHISALDKVVEHFSCQVYASLDEEVLLKDSRLSFYDKKIKSEITYITDDFKVGDFNIVLHKTPGHTKGSVMFQLGKHLFTGDTLFNYSIGRVDFPTGDGLAMQKSLDYIKTLDDDLLIYPGHGETSKLKYEKILNPYLKR